MNAQKYFTKKALAFSIFMAIFVGMTFALGITLTENAKVLAQQEQQQQQQQNQSSIPHNAKGHQSHQVVIFQNSSDGVRYSGTVTFNLSKPADVISFDDVTGKQPTNNTKIWEVGDKKFATTTLLKNVTQGSVNFNGSGILAHSTQSDLYNGSFTLNSTAISNSDSGR
ncbi:MAG: hypothetical protein H0X50_05385 [Nitrosopumilus sp.]|nr:hypothetical protein [Nitrosopumilus sp.]